MSKKIFYTKCNNFGDELNDVIFKAYSKEGLCHSCNIMKLDYVGVGSILDVGLLVLSSSKGVKTWLKNAIKQLKCLFVFKPIVVLSSGISFRYENPQNLRFARKMQFPIVRGKLTASVLKKSGYLKEDVVVGDIGLLASDLLTEKVEKKYSLGVIPHFRDLDSPLIWKILEKTPQSTCINVQDSPVNVIKKIAECERIVSTSLHGLIVADSLHVPNLWLENPWVHYERPIEDYRFKYNDYYSALGQDDMVPVEINDFCSSFNLEKIDKLYKMSAENIENKKSQLRETLDKIFK